MILSFLLIEHKPRNMRTMIIIDRRFDDYNYLIIVTKRTELLKKAKKRNNTSRIFFFFFQIDNIRVYRHALERIILKRSICTKSLCICIDILQGKFESDQRIRPCGPLRANYNLSDRETASLFSFLCVLLYAKIEYP